MKLNLACGMDYREGYVNIDDYSMYAGRMKTDKMDDVKTLKWQDDSVEEILLLPEAGFKDITWKYGGTHQRPERDITITATKI
jgi:hypothetical protein